MDVDDVAALDNTWFTAGFQDTASFFAKITTPLVTLASALQPADTGWVTLTSGTGTGTYTVGNSNTAITLKCRAFANVAALSLQLTIGTAITGNANGNITNVTMVTINDSRFVPSQSASLGVGGSGIAHFSYLMTNGALQIAALLPSVGFANGDAYTANGFYMLG